MSSSTKFIALTVFGCSLALVYLYRTRMDAKDQQPGLGTVAEGSERKASNAGRGRGGGRGAGRHSVGNSGRPPVDPSRTAGGAIGDESAPRSNRRKTARPPPPTPPPQTPLSAPVSRGNSSTDLGSAGKRPPQQRPPPPPPHPRGGGRPPRPITPKNRPVNSPAASSPAGSVAGNPVSGGGGGPRPYRPRPPRPVRPIHNATAAGNVPAVSDTATTSAPINSAEHVRPVQPIKNALPPHPAQPRHRPRPDPSVAAANARVRPKHKPVGKPAAAAIVSSGATATTDIPSSATPATMAAEDLPAPTPMPKTPQRTPNKPMLGPKESPKKKVPQANGSKGVAPLAKTENGTLDTPTRNNGKAAEVGDAAGPVPQPRQTVQPVPPPKPVERKPVTKVTIRWLPVNLPEHVFWRSVEPALPWFDPRHVGAVVQKERVVLRGLNPDLETVAASVEATANLESEAAPEQESAPTDDAEAECDPQAPLAAADDLPPSSLGATTTAMVDVYESDNLARLDSEPYWRAFVPGKQHQSRAKPADPARAYILFATPAEVDHFYRHYHGHAFSKSGTVSRAAVELSAFQHVPWSAGTSAGDMLSGTIDEDPDFIAFLAVDPNAIADLEATAGDGVAAAGIKPLAHVSYAAAASVTSANGVSDGDAKGAKETTTPLIDYLRELKGKAMGARPVNRPPAKGAAQGKFAAAAASSSAKTTASAPSRSGDVTPKKPRRRNR